MPSRNNNRRGKNRKPQENDYGVLDLIFNFRRSGNKLCTIKGCSEKCTTATYTCNKHDTSNYDALKKQITAEEEPWLSEYCCNKGCLCARNKGGSFQTCNGYAITCGCTYTSKCRKRDEQIGSKNTYFKMCSLPLLRVVVFGKSKISALLQSHWAILMICQKVMCIFKFPLLGLKKKIDENIRQKRLAIATARATLGEDPAAAALSKKTLEELMQGKKAVCKNFNRFNGDCQRGESCTFAHVKWADYERAKAMSESDKKWTKFDEKLSSASKEPEICKAFQTKKCRFGTKCNKAHFTLEEVDEWKKVAASESFVAEKKKMIEKVLNPSSSSSSSSSSSATAAAGGGGGGGENEDDGGENEDEDELVDDAEIRREKKRIDRGVALFPIDELRERSSFLDTMLGTTTNGSSNNQLRLYVSMMQSEIDELKDTVQKQQEMIEKLVGKIEEAASSGEK